MPNHTHTGCVCVVLAEKYIGDVVLCGGEGLKPPAADDGKIISDLIAAWFLSWFLFSIYLIEKVNLKLYLLFSVSYELVKSKAVSVGLETKVSRQEEMELQHVFKKTLILEINCISNSRSESWGWFSSRGTQFI